LCTRAVLEWDCSVDLGLLKPVFGADFSIKASTELLLLNQTNV
jgi:hypothetical protein